MLVLLYFVYQSNISPSAIARGYSLWGVEIKKPKDQMIVFRSDVLPDASIVCTLLIKLGCAFLAIDRRDLAFGNQFPLIS